MKLFMDTEATGFVQNKLPPDHPTQPYLVQLGAILTEDDGTEVSLIDLVVAPKGYEIPVQASNVHGITTARAKAIGLPLATVISAYVWLRASAEEVIAYNSDFDDLVMKANILRTGRTPTHPGPSSMTCCMRAAGPIMKLPPTEKMKAVGYDHWKPPSLKEAYNFFFHRDFEGKAHSALADARACKDIYFALKSHNEVPF